VKTYEAYLGLGANLGDRGAALNGAAAAIAKIPGVRLLDVSPVYETEPIGAVEQPPFLNAVVAVETTLAPADLLPLLREIETALGRRERERWGPREIDIDILLYDGLVYSDEAVTVPHPEMERRRFVLVPLREIAPDLVHPVNGMRVEEMAAAVRDNGRVKLSSTRIRW
jgi:2-amino-4-hydroxy-6-hydroxymethyldihydropteridine diphosphokinase